MRLDLQSACLFVGAVVLAGCARASFRPSVEGYAPKALERAPEVFDEQLPSKPYRAVGVIEVQAESDASRAEIGRMAREKGREVGCELLVDRALERRGEGDEQAKAVKPGVLEVMRQREFSCGVWR